MKQKLLNNLRLRAVWLVAMILCAVTGAWADKVTDIANIVSGGRYYIGATVSGTDYYFYADGSSVANGVQGTSKTDKAEAAVLVFEGSESSWSIKFDGTNNYLSLASSKANGKVNVVSDAPQWTAANTNDLISLTINNYMLQKNSASSLNFGSYASGQTNVWLEQIADASPLASIALSGTYPLTFHQGDAFSSEGIIVTATYENASTADVTSSVSFSGYDMSATGSQKVTVSYTENDITKTATYNITVNAPATLSSITLSGTYPIVFTQGDTFSSEGIIVTANYDDDSSKDVTEDAVFSGYDMSVTGTQTVTVTYGGKTATYSITVNEYVMPSELVIDFENDLSTYGEWVFDNVGTSNTAITAYGGNKYGATINSGGNGVASCSITTKNKVNPETITFYVSKVSANTSASSWSVEVSNNGTDWTRVGDNVSATNMSKGEWKEASRDLSTYSDVYVRICYSGSTAIRTIDDITLEMATPKVLSSIALSGEYPTTFHVDDTFNHDGIVVSANYEGGKTADVTADATFSTPDMTTAGTKTITVSYTENEVTKTATYDITVNAPATLTSIELSGEYSTEFQQGDEFNSEGIVVTANYDDQTTQIVTGEAEFSGYNMATIGEQTVTVSYGGKTATYSINVAEKKGTEDNPYTVAEAIEFIGTLGSETSSEQVYVSGIISQVDSYNSKYSSITYWISDDGSTTGQMEVYSGKGKDGADFSSVDDLQVSDIVTVKGNVKMYSSTPEFIQNNQIVSFERKELAEPEFSFGETNAFSIKIGDNFTAPTLTFAEGFDGTVTYESSNTDVATVANDGTVTVKAVGETVITASSVKTEEYKAGSASYTLTVNPAEAYNSDFAFAAESITIEVGATQAINYTTSSEGAITWESSNTSVATVDEVGNVTAVAIGEATITGSQAATDAYKAGSAELTVTVIAAQPVETFDFTTGYENAEVVEKVKGSVTNIVFAKATGATAPAFYTNGTALRLYNGNTLTVSSDVTITKIEFTFSAEPNSFNKDEESEGSYENDTWTGQATEISFNSTGKPRIQQIKVYYDANAQIKEKVTLSFGETTAFTVLPNADFTAPTLTATDDKDKDIENLTFTYESDDEDIAFVDANSGEILIGEKEGTATITATFAGNNDYKSATASYTITVEKAEAGLAYETTSFEVNINAEFNTPELVNPNQLTVTYSSDNENVAMVDENDGTIVIGSTAGKAVITATFAGNDIYKAGNASYTINVVDPSVEQNYVALVSELNGGYYAINGTLTSGKYGYEQVDAVNGKVINGKDDAISWFIENYNDGQSIQNKKSEKYLAYSGSSTNLAANDSPYEWEVSEELGWVKSSRTFMFRESTSGFKAYATSNLNSGDYGSAPAAYTFASGYTREVTAGNFGTICLPYDVEVGDFSGVKFYQIAGKKMNGNNVTSVILSDEVTSLEGGVAYIYQANEDAVKLIAAYSGYEEDTPIAASISKTGLTGTYEATYIPVGKYVLKDNTLHYVNQANYVKSGANKAYIDLANVPDGANVKGIRINVSNDYLTGINGVNVDGRQNVIFNLSGQRVSNANKGVYIVNGKKISVK